MSALVQAISIAQQNPKSPVHSLDREAIEARYAFKDVPHTFEQHSFRRLLQHCLDIGVSDIYLKTGDPVKVRVGKPIFKLTKRSLETSELNAIVTEVYGTNGPSKLGGGEAIDYAYELKLEGKRGVSVRFRMNATGCLSPSGPGVEIVMRPLQENPPEISAMKLPADLMEQLFPEIGLVLVTGETGSGKTTLLAAIIRHILEQPESNKRILTGEDPIEFVFDKCKRYSSMVAQHEIGRHLKSFSEFIRNAVRRDPNILMVGEMRDHETINAGIQAAQVGKAVYSTLHTNSVGQTWKRMVNVFPHEERVSKMVDLIDTTKVILTQRLVASTEKNDDGNYKRIALREFLVFDDEVKTRLIEQVGADVNMLPFLTHSIVQERGQLLVDEARRYYQQGMISEIEYKKYEVSASQAARMLGGETK